MAGENVDEKEQQAGQNVESETAGEKEREKFIPRERFDEVTSKKNVAENRVRELEAQLASSSVAGTSGDMFTQNQPYREQPVQQQQVDPYDAEARKYGVENLDQYATSYGFSAAMKLKDKVDNTSKTFNEMNDMQRQFAENWFKENNFTLFIASDPVAFT